MGPSLLHGRYVRISGGIHRQEAYSSGLHVSKLLLEEGLNLHVTARVPSLWLYNYKGLFFFRFLGSLPSSSPFVVCL